MTKREQVEAVKKQILEKFSKHGIEPHEETWEDGDVCILWASTTKASGVTVLIPTISHDGENLVIVITSEAMTSFRVGSVPEFQLEGQLSHYVDLPDDWEEEN